MIKENMKKKGISPVIATVLLIAMVVVLAGVVFAWFQNIYDEEITKFGGKNVKLVCDDVKFEVDYIDGKLIIKNNGDVPIYRIKAKFEGEGKHDSTVLGPGENWPNTGLAKGGIYSGEVNVENVDTIILIPILLGITSEGEQTHPCDERYGEPVDIKK